MQPHVFLISWFYEELGDKILQDRIMSVGSVADPLVIDV